MTIKTPIVLDGASHKPIPAGDRIPAEVAGIPAIKTGTRMQADVAACSDDGVAIGDAATANSPGAIAIGSSARAPNEKPQYGWQGAVAIGMNAKAHYDGVAIGSGSEAYRGVAIGGGKIVDDPSFGVGAIAIGDATAQQAYTIAIGSQASGNGGIAIGDYSSASGGVAVGHRATAPNQSAALGAYAKVGSLGGVALGYNAVTADTVQSYSIGAFSVGSRADVVSFGHTAKDFSLLNAGNAPQQTFRALACVANAVYQHDAVNGVQFNALASAINQIGANVSGFTPIALLPAEPA